MPRMSWVNLCAISWLKENATDPPICRIRILTCRCLSTKVCPLPGLFLVPVSSEIYNPREIPDRYHAWPATNFTRVGTKYTILAKFITQLLANVGFTCLLRCCRRVRCCTCVTSYNPTTSPRNVVKLLWVIVSLSHGYSCDCFNQASARRNENVIVLTLSAYSTGSGVILHFHISKRSFPRKCIIVWWIHESKFIQREQLWICTLIFALVYGKRNSR